jgi:hypothetical protein
MLCRDPIRGTFHRFNMYSSSRVIFKGGGSHMLVHNVFFSLKESSDGARRTLINDCHVYLSTIPGIVSFHCGILAEKNRRPVNDLDFDVGLHVIFESQEAHDAYQASDPHETFVERNQDNWAAARVFDSIPVDSKG